MQKPKKYGSIIIILVAFIILSFLLFNGFADELLLGNYIFSESSNSENRDRRNFKLALNKVEILNEQLSKRKLQTHDFTTVPQNQKSPDSLSDQEFENLLVQDYKVPANNIINNNVDNNDELTLTTKLSTNKKILFFLHFHKAGGHSICKTAAKNNYIIPQGSNCNAFLTVNNSKSSISSSSSSTNQSPPLTIYNTKDDKISCCGETLQDQQNFAKSTKYTFVANEKQLHQDFDTEYYDYMVVFREPWSRYASHYKYARDYFFSKKLLGSFETWVRSQPDNFMLRSVCGPICQSVPTGQLTDSHLEFVKNRLDKFSAVLILENFSESMKIMIHKFGWKEESQPFHGNPNKKSSSELVATEEIMEKYHYLVTFDVELYEYARYLSQRQIEQVVYRPSYQELNCENSCCSKICSKYRRKRSYEP